MQAVDYAVMDALDRKIIVEMQNDGRISVTDLAELLPLSVSATRERLRRLESSGIIAGFTVQVDPAAVGRTIEALVDVRVRPEIDTTDLEENVRRLDSVVDALQLTGRFDMQLHVMATDVAELDELLTQLKDVVGAEETNTRLVLRTIDGFPRQLPMS